MISSTTRLQTVERLSLGGVPPLSGLLPECQPIPEERAISSAPVDPNQAIAREKVFIALRAAEYDALLQKIKDYQCRSTSAPSDTELEKWRECMEYRIATRKLQSGIVDLQVFPNCRGLPLN